MQEEIKELNPLAYKPVGKLLKSLAIPAIIANLVSALPAPAWRRWRCG